eukprot:scaffold64953_cov63-Phaeocystis_antarctica.AAC.1
MLDLAERVGSIIPGVLSSHLDPVTRTFSAGHYADRLRSQKHGTEVITRIIVGHKSDGQLELRKAANGGNGSTDSGSRAAEVYWWAKCHSIGLGNMAEKPNTPR